MVREQPLSRADGGRRGQLPRGGGELWAVLPRFKRARGWNINSTTDARLGELIIFILFPLALVVVPVARRHSPSSALAVTPLASLLGPLTRLHALRDEDPDKNPSKIANTDY